MGLVPAAEMERVDRALLDVAAGVLATGRGGSMQQIAEAAGVSRATLHRRFPSRDALVRATSRHALVEISGAIDACVVDDGPVETILARLAELLVPMGHRYAFLIREFHTGQDPDLEAAVEEFADRLATLLERGRQEGALRTDLPLIWMVDALIGLVEMAWEGVRDGRLAPRDAPGLVVTTFLSGTRAAALR